MKLSFRDGTSIQTNQDTTMPPRAIVCSHCRVRVMAIRRPLKMGIQLIHNECPDCVLQSKVSDETIDTVKLQLGLLLEQYKTLFPEEKRKTSSIWQNLCDTLQSVIEELSATNGEAMLNSLKKLIDASIPDMEQRMQEKAMANMPLSEDGHVETIAVLKQLRLDYQTLSRQFLNVLGKSTTAEGAMRTQLDDIMGQMEDFRNQIRQDQVQFGSIDIEQVKDGFADLMLEMCSFRGKLRRLKGKVVGFLSLDRRTRSLERFFGECEESLDQRGVEEKRAKSGWLSPDQSPSELCKELKEACDSMVNSSSKCISIANKGGIRAIVLVMQQHADDTTLLQLSCEALKYLALDSDYHLEQIRNEGGIAAVISALQRHVDHPGVQAHCCYALVNLAWSADNQIKIVHEGGLTSVVAALRRHVNDPGVQHAGCWALKILAASNENIKRTIANEGGLSAIIAALQRHPQHIGVQEQGCAALANLSSGNDNQRTISDEGGIAAMIAALQRQPQNARVQEYASVALSHVSFSCPSEVKQAGGVEALQHAKAFVASAWISCVDDAISRMNEL